MPFLRKTIVRRYCIDELNMSMSMDFVEKFNSYLCLMLQSAAAKSKSRGYTVIKTADLLEVVKHGVDDMSTGQHKYPEVNKAEEEG